MRVAILDAQGVIRGLEDISEKGIAEGYRPSGIVVDAQPDWQKDGVVVGDVYTPPPPKDFSGEDQDRLNAALLEEGSVVRAIVAVMRDEINLLRDAVSPVLPQRTVAQMRAALKAKMRTP